MTTLLGTVPAAVHTGSAPYTVAAFIKADIRGVFASVFCDFGPRFEVADEHAAGDRLSPCPC